MLPQQAEYTAKYQLTNENADENTQRTYDYICEMFGKNILSAQQESTWMDGGNADYEMDIIEEATGKLPAIRGLDFMNGDFDGVVQRAKEWHEQGGIVTIMWHTGVNGRGYTESLNDNPDFDLILTEGTPEYEAMIANWDQAAEALTELRDAGIPVIWRPFHEFDGQWFWWGKGGADNFIKLWQMMYDYFTDEYNLTNLIWCLGYSGSVRDGWYPGDEYCDIIGSDSYDSFANNTNKNGWDRLQNVTDADKPLAFHECGIVPSVDAFESDGTIWSWFMIWHSTYITDNDEANLNELYNSDLVITLDELPDLETYTPDDTPDSDSSSETDESSEDVSDSSESQADSSSQTSADNSSEAPADDSSLESPADDSSADSGSQPESPADDSSEVPSVDTSNNDQSSTGGDNVVDDNPTTGAAVAGVSALTVVAAAMMAVRKRK